LGALSRRAGVIVGELTLSEMQFAAAFAHAARSHRLKPAPDQGDTAPVLLLLADDTGSFTVSPNLALVLWTLLVFLLVAAVIYAVVRLVAHSRRNG
jgi:hypothetical protein